MPLGWPKTFARVLPWIVKENSKWTFWPTKLPTRKIQIERHWADAVDWCLRMTVWREGSNDKPKLRCPAKLLRTGQQGRPAFQDGKNGKDMLSDKKPELPNLPVLVLLQSHHRVFGLGECFPLPSCREQYITGARRQLTTAVTKNLRAYQGSGNKRRT